MYVCMYVCMYAWVYVWRFLKLSIVIRLNSIIKIYKPTSYWGTPIGTQGHRLPRPISACSFCACMMRKTRVSVSDTDQAATSSATSWCRVARVPGRAKEVMLRTPMGGSLTLYKCEICPIKPCKYR